jgi:hypothetical protein
MYAIEIGSGAICIPSFIKIDSGVQKLIGGIYMQTHRQLGDLISLVLFFQNEGSRLRKEMPRAINQF